METRSRRTFIGDEVNRVESHRSRHEDQPSVSIDRTRCSGTQPKDRGNRQRAANVMDTANECRPLLPLSANYRHGNQQQNLRCFFV